MTTVTVSVAHRDEVTRRALAAFAGEPQGARISFESVEALWKTLTPRRWDVLRAITGQGPLSLREVARRVGRDVKTVHGDAHLLLVAGLLDRTDDGRLLFPYDAIHVDFTLKAA